MTHDLLCGNGQPLLPKKSAALTVGFYIVALAFALSGADLGIIFTGERSHCVISARSPLDPHVRRERDGLLGAAAKEQRSVGS